ncbi:MAG: tRNA (guanosine(37)-N1)-methyltransferase TrmD, partial [Candidatus Binatia bacterium]
MDVEILTLFPSFFDSPLSASLVGKGIRAGRIRVAVTDIRDFAEGAHRVADDAPYGGGEGMVMKVEPVVAALEAARARSPAAWRVLLSPRGRRLTQPLAAELAARSSLVLVCGRYEGVDERVRGWIDEELSIGDYVLAGGETAALVVVDVVTRLVPGFIGNARSLAEESFQANLLEYPQYTRPETFRELRVPEVLLSGDHAA